MNLNLDSELFLNGRIYTLDPRNPWVETMLVSGGEIVHLASGEEAAGFVSKGVEVHDLQGRLVLPGFVDAHAHPSHAVDLFEHIDLYQLDSIEDYQARINQFMRDHPGREMYRGSGWDNTLFPLQGPGVGLLDHITGDKPVALISYDYHSMWVNSAMLARAGISRHTPNPEGGVIEREPGTGEPSGTLRETAMRLVEEILPDYSQPERLNTLHSYQERAFKAGVTLCHDAMLDGQAIAAYRALAAAGQLQMNFRGSILVEPGKPTAEQIEMLIEQRHANRGSAFQTNTAKLFVDGVVEGGTAYLLEPYANQPGYQGELIWDPGQLKEICAALDKEQVQIHMHVIGDAAARAALDALEYARSQNGARDARHLLTHMQLVNPADIPRFRQLGVVAVLNPFWFKIDDYYQNLALPYLGAERALRQYPLRSFIGAGVKVASASDFPVTIDFDPLVGIEMGVTRSPVGTTGREVLWPEERASLLEMISTFTLHGAYANFLEQRMGSLEVGKQADFVVLERNIFEIPPEEIASTQVWGTFVRGRQVYQAED